MVEFQSIPVDTEFTSNGTRWKKSSSRTARLVENPDRWFYFGQKELVTPVMPKPASRG